LSSSLATMVRMRMHTAMFQSSELLRWLGHGGHGSCLTSILWDKGETSEEERV